MSIFASQQEASPLSASVRQLVDLGFHILPLLPSEFDDGTTNNWTPQYPAHGKAPGEFGRGVWKPMYKWEKYCERAPSELELKMWADRWPGANVGIALGVRVLVGDNLLKLVAFDIDTPDTDFADEIVRLMPFSPNAKRGRKGQTNLYLAPIELQNDQYSIGPRGNSTRIVDLLAFHRQTVAPPSIHPETLKPYEWIDPAGLVHVSKLPVLEADHISAFEELMGARGWRRETLRSHVSRETSGPVSRAEDTPFDAAKNAAMGNFEAWVPQLGLVNLERHGSGFRATAHWRAGGTGRPLGERKRNLSIQPEGIKDFGDNATYTPVDLTMTALGLTSSDALDWLNDKLGLSAPITTTFDLSRQALGRAGGRRGLRVEVVQEAELAPPPVRVHAYRAEAELPSRLTVVPGLLGAVSDWICNTSRRPQAGLSMGAALAVVGTCAGRRYAGPTVSGTHLYVLGLARTAAGKDHALKAIPELLQAAGLPQAVGPSQFMSLSSVIGRVGREPRTLCGMDEFGSFIGRINSRRASPHEAAISGMLRTLWGSSFQTVAPPEWASQKAEPIHAPALSIYGVSTPKEFYDALRGGDVSNGFLNRFLLMSTKARPEEREPKLPSREVPLTIAHDLKRIATHGSSLRAMTMHVNRADPPETVADWRNSEARAVYRDFGKYIENEREADIDFLARTVEMAIRMATIRAVGIDHEHPRIGVDDIQWACELALWSAERMMVEVREWMAENDHQSEAQRALRFIREKGRAAHWEVVRHLQHKMKARDVAQMLDGLVDAKQAIAFDVVPEGGGRVARYYEACDVEE